MIILSTFFYLIYVQFSPSMGNIWYRSGQFIPSSALNLMISPLWIKYMWYPSFWDINYFMWLVFGELIGKLKYFITNNE